MSTNDPPGASTCHWTVGAGLPVAAAISVTGLPANVDASPGDAVTCGASSTAIWKAVDPADSVPSLTSNVNASDPPAVPSFTYRTSPASMSAWVNDVVGLPLSCTAPWPGPVASV